MSKGSDPRLYYPHVARNREAIVAVLRRVLPPRGLVLEIASGSGEHAAYFAKELPTLLWQPTDPDPQALASIAAHRAAGQCRELAGTATSRRYGEAVAGRARRRALVQQHDPHRALGGQRGLDGGRRAHIGRRRNSL